MQSASGRVGRCLRGAHARLRVLVGRRGTSASVVPCSEMAPSPRPGARAEVAHACPLPRGNCAHRRPAGGLSVAGRAVRADSARLAAACYRVRSSMRQAGFEPTTFGSGGWRGRRPPTVANAVSTLCLKDSPATAGPQRPRCYNPCDNERPLRLDERIASAPTRARTPAS